MILYYAGVDRATKDIRDTVSVGAQHFMISYFYRKTHVATIRQIRKLGAHIMLDSGAFSAWKQGGAVDLHDYIGYIRESGIGKYVALDVVGDPERSEYNLGIMQGAALTPIPVFHYGSEWRFMDRLAADFPYVAVGGTVGRATPVRDQFFAELFERYPSVKFHGLGMTTAELVRKYPWFSVDSTAWLAGKKNYRLQTDNGSVQLGYDVPVSDRVKASTRYFVELENKIRTERYGSI